MIPYGFPNRKSIKLYHDPIVWSENSELKGDSIVILTRDSIIDKIYVYELISHYGTRLRSSL